MSSVEDVLPLNRRFEGFWNTGVLFASRADSFIVSDVGDVVWSVDDVHVSLRVFHTLARRGYSVVLLPRVAWSVEILLEVPFSSIVRLCSVKNLIENELYALGTEIGLFIKIFVSV